MTDNVHALPGLRAPQIGEPNESLVAVCRDLLARAESGSLQSLIATGFSSEGSRLALWADAHDNFYEMLGALASLQAEYLHRHQEKLG